MKKKEREHLKEDPFQHFIQGVLETLKQFKKEILIGLGVVGVLVVVILVVLLVRAGSIAKENRIYSDALLINNNPALSVDQKIEKLSQLKSGDGVSASAKLFLASLYFEKGNIEKATETLNAVPKSSSDLIEGKKKLLHAEILNASGKTKEALDAFNQILANPKSVVPKDFLLLRMAKIQSKDGQKDTAITNLNKLVEDHPQSPYAYEARNLLNELEK